MSKRWDESPNGVPSIWLLTWNMAFPRDDHNFFNSFHMKNSCGYRYCNLPDFLDLFFTLSRSHTQIVVGLEIAPELRAGTEILAEAQRGVGGNRSSSFDNCIDTRRRHMDVHSQFILADSHRFEKFFREDFTWMDQIFRSDHDSPPSDNQRFPHYMHFLHTR